MHTLENNELITTHDTFRDAMGSIATPVSVVTTIEDGRPHGTTVSAFASLSMDPPMVLVSLDKGSNLLARIESTGRFGLNVLPSDQSDLALRFARKGEGKFDGVDWSNESGSARLRCEVTWVACTVAEIVEGGDHMVVFGHVVATEAAQSPPLTYHSRTFGTHLKLA